MAEKKVWTHEKLMELKLMDRIKALQDINFGRAKYVETNNPNKYADLFNSDVDM